MSNKCSSLLFWTSIILYFHDTALQISHCSNFRLRFKASHSADSSLRNMATWWLAYLTRLLSKIRCSNRTDSKTKTTLRHDIKIWKLLSWRASGQSAIIMSFYINSIISIHIYYHLLELPHNGSRSVQCQIYNY